MKEKTISIGMTVREYLEQNPNKASYTIKTSSGRRYLCRAEEANLLFGHLTIIRVQYRGKNENLPILTVK